MPDLTDGYRGPDPGNSRVVEAIFRQSPLNVGLPGGWLARALFTNNFMPYARSCWRYEGSLCNCEDLARALYSVWYYVKTVKRPRGLEELPVAELVKCSEDAIITKPRRVFQGPEHGNIRLQGTGVMDLRCLFATHWICKIGTMYFDPTYDCFTTVPDDIVERTLKPLLGSLHLSTTGDFLYARNLNAAPGFTDSWNEMNAVGWISAQAWKTKTARSHHARSAQLQTLDAALQAFQQDGAEKLPRLKHAFTEWVRCNPGEAAARNIDKCVTGLATFLGVSIHLRV